MAPVRRPLPGTRWRRGVLGRQALETYLDSHLDARKSDPGTDFFSTLCTATSEDGGGLSDREIIDHLMFLLLPAPQLPGRGRPAAQAANPLRSAGNPG